MFSKKINSLRFEYTPTGREISSFAATLADFERRIVLFTFQGGLEEIANCCGQVIFQSRLL